MRRLLLVVVLGCGGSSTPPAETAKATPAATDPRGACEAAIKQAGETGRAGQPADPSQTKVAAAMVDGCVAMTWSSEMLLCLTNSKTETELETCEQLLTPAQLQDMNQRFDAILRQEDAARGSAAAGSAAPP